MIVTEIEMIIINTFNQIYITQYMINLQYFFIYKQNIQEMYSFCFLIIIAINISLLNININVHE
jgi:hypothetical protein